MDALRAPPAVLLHQLQVLERQGDVPALDLLLQNPALLIRTLDALHGTSGTSGLSTSVRLDSVDPVWLRGLVAHAALQLALQETPLDHAFLVHHWQMSRRCALAAAAFAQESGYPDPQAAAITGLLLRAGMLAVPQQTPLPAALADGAWQPAADDGSDAGQAGYIEAGVRLLESWRFDQFGLDALRYQALPLQQVLDAAPLVKICWLANACAAADLQPQAELLDAGRELFGFDAERMHALLDTLGRVFAAECLALELPALAAVEFSGKLARELAQDGQQKLQQLRAQILTEHMLARHAGKRFDTAGLREQLANVLQDAGIDPVFLLMASDGAGILQTQAGNRTQTDPDGLALTCGEGRSALATAILNHEIAAVSATTPRLAVIDRQVINLLGGHHVLCETVQSGSRRAVLLLGLTAAELKHYPARSSLRRFLRRVLQGMLGDDGGTLPLAAALYQQRVREAVHEARNPLTIIKNYLHIHGMKQGAEADDIRLIKSEIDRVSAILGGLLEPDAAAAFSEIDLNRLVGSMHKVFATAVCADDSQAKSIQLNLALSAEPARVLGSDNLLKQILANLVKNAAEAIDDIGAITISTRVNIFMHGRLYVELNVADNGSGIAPEFIKRIFEPGVTTKTGPQRGSGLGIVRRLCEEMQGEISCQSDSKGTVVTVLLPQAS